jgi:GH35 family endo-1,4-beta-xylanase
MTTWPVGNVSDLLWEQRPQYTPIKDLFARRGLKFGWLLDNNTATLASRYWERDLLVRECNMGTAGNFLGMDNTQRFEGVFDYYLQDAYDLCVANNLEQHHAAHLMWYRTVPTWMEAYTDPTVLRGKVRAHFDRIIADFDQVDSFNVVNEAFYTNDGNPNGWRDGHFYSVFGANWPTEWFKYARTLTSRELVWCENYTHRTDATFDNTKAAIIAALDDGAPIDTFAYQMHIEVAGVGAMCSPAQLVDRLGQIVDLGLDLRISEMDVYDIEDWFPLSTRRADTVAAVEEYLGPIIAQVPQLKSVNMWSPNDITSWVNFTTGWGNRTDGFKGEFSAVDRAGFVKPEWWEMFERITRP